MSKKNLLAQKPRVLAAHQPNFMPWIGYWLKFYSATDFVHLTDAQFSKGQFQNRSQYEIDGEQKWLTTPVITKGRLGQSIRDVEINNDRSWRKKHLATIAQYFPIDDVALAEPWQRLNRIYSYPWKSMCELNLAIIHDCIAMNAATFEPPRTHLDTSLLPQDMAEFVGEELGSGPDNRLIWMCKLLGCDTYLAGPTGRGYMDLEKWEKAAIKVDFMPSIDEIRSSVGTDLSSSNYFLNSTFQTTPEEGDE